MLFCLSTHLSWFQRENVNSQTSCLNQAEDNSFLDETVKDFKHGLDSYPHRLHWHTRTGCIHDEGDIIPSWVCLGFLCSLVPFLIFPDSSWLLASIVMNYGTRLGHFYYLYHRKDKCWPLKLIHYFSRHQAGFEFFDIILNPANRKTDQSFCFSDWYWCRHRAAYFLYQSCLCWYNCLSVGFWWRSYGSLISAWITY